MITHKELIAIIIASIVLAFSITLVSDMNYFLVTLLGVFILIFINTISKKVAAYYFETKIEIKLWEFKRIGFKPWQKLKRNFPAGLFFPIISKVIFVFLGSLTWMASLVFTPEAKTYKSAKRHGIYSYSELSEGHIGYIAAFGIFINLVFAILAYLIGFSDFAKFSIWFAFFNLIPISNLDGNKIFFGNKVLWSILSIITLIAIVYTFFII